MTLTAAASRHNISVIDLPRDTRANAGADTSHLRATRVQDSVNT